MNIIVGCTELDKLIRPMPRSKYEVDYGFNFVERALAALAENGGLELAPDFQRGHVWTQEQQERWIEAVIRGAISTAGLMIQFNAPAWESGQYRGLMPKKVLAVPQRCVKTTVESQDDFPA